MVDSDDYGIKLGGNRSKQNPAKSSKIQQKKYFLFFRVYEKTPCCRGAWGCNWDNMNVDLIV